MNITHTLIAFVCSIGFLHAAADNVHSGAYFTQLRAGAWLGQMSTGTFDADGATPEIELEDIGYDDSELGFYIEAGIRPPLVPMIPDIHVGYITWNVEEEDIDSELQHGNLYIEATWGLAIGDLAGAWVGVAAHILDVTIDTANTTTYDEGAVIPAIAARAFVHPFNDWDLHARIHISEGLDDTVLDIEAYASYYPLSALGIQAGLRYFSFTLEDDDILEEAIIGPFAGISVQY